jgi:hypothetical protein
LKGVVQAAIFLFVAGLALQFFVSREAIMSELSNLLAFSRYSLVGELPECDSRVTIELAKKVIQESAIKAIIKITVFDIRDAVELSYDAVAGVRRCRAMMFSNVGKGAIIFHLEWANQEKGDAWLQIDSM